MNLIVAVDQKLGIGQNDQLLFHIPADMRFFRSMTLHKTVIMGRKTFETFPGRQPLPQRTNVILSGDPAYSVPGALCCHSMAELQAFVQSCLPEDVFLIGGASLYHKLYDCCEKAYITRIEAVRSADSTFPDLLSQPNWRLTQQSEWLHHEALSFRFCTYTNQSPKPFPTV